MTNAERIWGRDFFFMAEPFVRYEERRSQSSAVVIRLATILGGTLLLCNGAWADPPSAAVLDGLARQSQQAPKLCWAATATMAVNFLFRDQPDRLIDQAVDVSYRSVGFDEDTQLDRAMVPADQVSALEAQLIQFNNQLAACRANIQTSCNTGGDPILIGLDCYRSSNGTPLHRPLTRKEIMTEIRDQQRPFIFSWDLADSAGSGPAYHYLIGVGYDDRKSVAKKFLVMLFDPWPVGSDSDPASNFPKVIKLSAYRNPDFDFGACTSYRDSWYQMKRKVPLPALPPGLTVSAAPGTLLADPADAADICKPRHPGVYFQEAIAQALSLGAGNSELNWRRPFLPGPLDLGAPFPVVLLSHANIIAARESPLRAMDSRTSTVLYPVVSGVRVVDAFTRMRGFLRWRTQGYANTQITARLVRARDLGSTRFGVDKDKFFVLAIPQSRAFFAAFQQDTRTMLIPTVTDPAIGVTQYEARPADEILGQIRTRLTAPRVDH